MADEPQYERSGAPLGRLLPWTSDEGKPCYLSAGSSGGMISRMADVMEAEQVRCGREVLAGSRLILEESGLGKVELRFIVNRLVECLSDVLRIAESRGLRLGIEDPRPDDEAEELTDAEAGE
ncbi:hypothetical protein [Streptomyces werraensis]|uniref:hypothetical protein n=1 Tax=Streptomyces werraensis TaxID=68284 RepID=UPI00380423BE